MQSDQCISCRHYRGALSCDAFKKIPQKILEGTHDHTEPFRGDGGIRFEPLEKKVKKAAG
jgi:hypothetical protein